jgi:hypothetical protein
MGGTLDFPKPPFVLTELRSTTCRHNGDEATPGLIWPKLRRDEPMWGDLAGPGRDRDALRGWGAEGNVGLTRPEPSVKLGLGRDLQYDLICEC